MNPIKHFINTDTHSKNLSCAKCRKNLDYNIQYERKNGLIYCRDCAIQHDNARNNKIYTNPQIEAIREKHKQKRIQKDREEEEEYHKTSADNKKYY